MVYAGLESTYGEEHVRHILLHGLGVRNGVQGLAYTSALTRENSLVDAETRGRDGEQPTVRRDLVTDRNGDNIARDEV